MPHQARPSIHAKASQGKKGNGPRNIPDLSPKEKPRPTLKGKTKGTSAKPGRRGK